MTRVAAAISEDVESFEQIMRRLEIRPSRVKPAVASAAERLGRFKLNGRLMSYSALSRFEELDFLAMGIEGKKVLWANLREVAKAEPRLREVDFDLLIERAERQRSELEPFRIEARRLALHPTRELGQIENTGVS